MSTCIYLDHGSSTPVDPKVLDEMLPCFTRHFGNSGSINHRYGIEANDLVRGARKSIAELISAEERDIVFTSCATESNNLAILGVAGNYADRGNHLITLKSEHQSVLQSMRYLESTGFVVTYLGVDSSGLLDLEELANSIRNETILISISHGNNEIGTVQNIREVGELARQNRIIFHVDAAQTFGKLPIHVEKQKIDLLSISSHKIYGPKGIGALYVRRKKPRVRLRNMIHGGGQERGLRSGTLNVPGIVGLGAASRIANTRMDDDSEHLKRLSDYFLNEIQSLGGVTLNGDENNRVPGNLNVSIDGVDAKELVCQTQDIAFSLGSACHNDFMQPSHVLLSIGKSAEVAASTIRLGFGRFNTLDEIEMAVEAIKEKINSLRSNRAEVGTC